MDHETRNESKEILSTAGELCEVAVFIQNDWSRHHAARQNQLQKNSFIDVTVEMNNVLRKVQSDLMHCIMKMLSHFPSDAKQALLFKVQKLFPGRVVSDMLQSSVEYANYSEIHAGATSDTTISAASTDDDQLIKDRIRRQYRRLANRLNAQSIAAEMFQQKAITRAELQKIQAKRSKSIEAAEILLDILMSDRWHQIGGAFVDALQQVNQDDIYLQLCGIDLPWDVQERIRENYRDLVDQIDSTTSVLLTELRAQDVLDDAELQELTAVRANFRRNEKLLSIMIQKTQKMFDIFLECLDSTGQAHMAAILRGMNPYISIEETRLIRSQQKPQSASSVKAPGTFASRSNFEVNFLRTLPPGKFIHGLTTLDNQLLVSYSGQDIEVYDVSTYSTKRQLTVPGLGLVYDIVSCQHYRCIYIAEQTRNVIHRVEVKSGGSGYGFTKWTADDVPHSLSITANHELIVTCSKVSKVKLFTTNGELTKVIELQRYGINQPLHTLQLTAEPDRYVVSHCGNLDKVPGSLHRVCIVDGNGVVQKSFGGRPGSGESQLSGPMRLAIVDGFIFVNDMNNHRVLMLSPTLSYVRTVVSGLKGAPAQIWFDKQQSRLYLSENTWDAASSRFTTGHVNVYDVRHQ